MKHYLLNGYDDIVNWVENAEFMTEEQAIASVPDELLAFVAYAQAMGELPMNGIFSSILNAGKSLIAGASNITKSFLPTLAKGANGSLTSLATNFLKGGGGGLAGGVSAGVAGTTMPQVAPTKISAPQVAPQAQPMAAPKEEKKWYENPIVLIGGGLLAYKLIKG